MDVLDNAMEVVEVEIANQDAELAKVLVLLHVLMDAKVIVALVILVVVQDVLISALMHVQLVLMRAKEVVEEDAVRNVLLHVVIVLQDVPLRVKVLALVIV